MIKKELPLLDLATALAATLSRRGWRARFRRRPLNHVNQVKQRVECETHEIPPTCPAYRALAERGHLHRADDPNGASQILTRELAQKILGAPVETSSNPALPDMQLGATWVSRISYQAAAGGVAATSISLLIRHAANLAETRPTFESSKETFHGEDVAGLGDAAYRTKAPAQLDVLKGGNWLIISAGTARDPSATLQEKAAHEILAKMPN